MGALAPVLASQETLGRGPFLPMRGPGSRRGAARGQSVEVLASVSLFLWGKIFNIMILVFRCLCAFSGYDLSYVIPLFLRLKRPLEQAQPSMANKLKVGAVPKGSGEWLILLLVVLGQCDSCFELLSG